jgi:hypothetical protein
VRGQGLREHRLHYCGAAGAALAPIRHLGSS